MSLRLHLAYTFFRGLALSVLASAPLALLYAAQPTLPAWLQAPVGLLVFPVDVASSLLQAAGHSGVFIRMYGVFLALLLGYLPILWGVILATTPRDPPPAPRTDRRDERVDPGVSANGTAASGRISPSFHASGKRDNRD